MLSYFHISVVALDSFFINISFGGSTGNEISAFAAMNWQIQPLAVIVDNRIVLSILLLKKDGFYYYSDIDRVTD